MALKGKSAELFAAFGRIEILEAEVSHQKSEIGRAYTKGGGDPLKISELITELQDVLAQNTTATEKASMTVILVLLT